MALDAGLLAAAASLYNIEDVSDADVVKAKKIGKEYFKEALGKQAGATIPDPTFTYDADKEEIKASVKGKMDTNFLVVTGLTEMEVAANATAKVGHEEIIGSDVEVALMLDVTGSMCDGSAQPCSSGTNVNALKTASKQLIDAVLWKDQSKYTSKIAVIPFSNRIRLEPDGAAGPLYTAVTGLDTTWTGYVGSSLVRNTLVTTKKNCEKLTNYSWSNNKCYQQKGNLVNYKAEPCVTERYFGNNNKIGLTEDAPAVGRYNNGSDGTRFPKSLDSVGTASTAYNSSEYSWLNSAPTNYSADGVCDKASYYISSNNKYGWAATDAIPNSNALLPLTSDKSILDAKIDGLGFQGGTGGVLGTSFAWYTISPAWKHVWGAASAPQPYEKMAERNANNKPKLFKIAILMTDGVYNTAWSSPTVIQTSSTDENAVTHEKNAKDICSSMKAKGIEVYTVGFNLSDTSTAKAMLANCATDAAHFKDASSPDELKAAFKEIGKRIKPQAAMEIRLTQ